MRISTTSCVAAAALVAGGIFYACGGSEGTNPSPTSPVAVAVPTEAKPTPSPQAGGEDDGETPRPVNAICNDKTGECHFETDKLRPVNGVCTPPGQVWHPGSPSDWGTWSGTTDDTVNALDICDSSKIPSVEDERCEPVTINVQVDFHAAGRHAGHLGPSWAITFPVNSEECGQCEPGEFEPVGDPIIEEGDWGECPQVEVDANNGNGCYECRIVTTTQVFSNGCEKEERTERNLERRPVDCPTCDDFPTPEVTVDWEIVEQEAEGGVLAAGHTCNAQHNAVITPSICAPPFDIDPPLPHLVPWETSQLFTFDWAGTYSPAEGLECEISGQETDTVEAGPPPCDPEEIVSREPTSCGLIDEGLDPEKCYECFLETNACGDRNVVADEIECAGNCFYNNRGDDGKEECEALPGFVSWNEANHLCELEFPGISDDDFQLNPGQSALGCLRKQDD